MCLRVIAFAVCALVAGCGGTQDVTLVATPRIALIDAPLAVHAVGLKGRATLTVSANDAAGKLWAASGPFKTGEATSLLSSMLPAGFRGDPREAEFTYGPVTRFRLALRDGKDAIAETTTVRRISASGVTVEDQTVKRVGFRGFYCSGPVRRGPAILKLGGSEGGLPSTIGCRLLASHGYPTLALAYFGVRGLPPALSHVRLEYFASALRWLRRQPGVDPKKVLVMGASRGGEAALILGAIYPTLVRGVIGYAPSSLVNPALRGPNPAWTLDGHELPFFEVPVERINGPVFVVGGGRDELWPAAIQVDHIRLRMQTHGRRDVVALTYPRAGHEVVTAVPNFRTPTIITSRYGILGMGGTPAADAAARAASWKKLLAFLSAL